MKPALVEEQSFGIIQPRSLRDQIVEVLQDAIIAGEYQPGQRLVEREFVTRFGVSSIPVREALQELETRGLVVKRHNRGCTVVNLTPEQQQKACAVRLLLEPQVIGWAGVNYLAPLHRDELLELAQKLTVAADENDHPEYFRQDLVLHRMLWSMSGNEYAARALEPIVGSLFAMGHLSARTSAVVDLRREADKHVQLVNAIIAGTPPAAADILREIAEGYEAVLSSGVTPS